MSKTVCRDCEFYKGDPAGSGVCWAQAITDPVHGKVPGLAFGNEGEGDQWDECDLFKPGARSSPGRGERR